MSSALAASCADLGLQRADRGRVVHVPAAHGVVDAGRPHGVGDGRSHEGEVAEHTLGPGVFEGEGLGGRAQQILGLARVEVEKGVSG